MNEVSIQLKCGNSITIIDEEKLDHTQLAQKLSGVFSVNNIAILNGQDSSIVLRPSDISTIKIKTFLEEPKPVEATEEIVEDPPQKIEPTKETKEEIIEDIVTDMD